MRDAAGVVVLLALSACVHAVPRDYSNPVPPPGSSSATLLEHASIEGTLAGAGHSTKRNFAGGVTGGLLLGPVGVLIAYNAADADPAYVPIVPTPRYADTSATYVAAFRQAYDRQVQADRRSAALGGGILGMVGAAAIIVTVAR